MMNVLKKIGQVILLLGIVLFLVALGMPIGMIIAYWNDLPSLEPLEYETPEWHYPTKVYSDISRISLETSLNNLQERLERLNYEQVEEEPMGEGQFHLRNPAGSPAKEMKLHLRQLNYPRLTRSPRLITIQINDGKISRIKAADGALLTEFILEPEVIAEFYGSEGIDRELVSLSQLPDNLVKAFVAIEDKRFYSHFGFDPFRIAKSLWWNLTHDSVQGASTITQQLAQNLFLTKRQLWSRKIKEALLAVRIERRYTKDEILERYLNRINLGRYSSREIYGVREAARYYFRKDPQELNLQECATLAAIPKDQWRYSPIRNPENSRRRRQIVLRQMLRWGFITREQYEEASDSPLETTSIRGYPSREHAPYFLDYIRLQVESKYEPSAIYSRGLSVYTTIDVSFQQAAERAVQKRLRSLDGALGFPPYEENKARWLASESKKEENLVDPKSYLQAALVCIDPSTGDIKAMVGGRDWYVSQFNRAVQAVRQPGSAFKPFVYCAGFANRLINPTDVVVDEPWEIEDPSQPDGFWRPENFYNKFYGQVTVRKMLTKSINVATARLLYERIGPEKAAATARTLGIKTPLAPLPSLALGSMGVRPLDMTSAYGVFASQGMRTEPVCVKYILDMEGNILEENRPPARRVLDENVAYLVTYLMQGAVNEGTGQNLRKIYVFKRPAAGKTGTTNDEADAWFIGFVPGLVAGVWVGFDDYSKSTHHSGALAALPIWADFIKAVVDGPVRDFPVPSGIVFREVDADTGLLPTAASETVKEAFLKGTEPAL